MGSASTSKIKRGIWRLAELAHQFFSGAEAKAVEGAGGLESLRTFFQFWSLKEAALKSIGEGLPFGLDAFEFELDPKCVSFMRPLTTADRSNLDAHVIEGRRRLAPVERPGRSRTRRTTW